MKSSWAYNNGKRIMKDSKDSTKAPLRGWVKVGRVEEGDFFRYAERNKHDETKLVVKTYANKEQALKIMEVLRDEGADCWLRLNYPFVIECTEKRMINWSAKDL